jgi:hydrogenase maturation protease
MNTTARRSPWSYLKFPYLKAVGWNGITDGADSGVYRVNSLARLNVADGMATPLAQHAYDELFSFYGGKPVHHTLAFHWARIVELLYACEEVQRRAVIVDAIDIGAKPGTVVHHHIDDLETPASAHASVTYGIDLTTALEAGRRLGLPLPDEIHIVAVQVADTTTLSERCTPAVEAAIDEAAKLAVSLASGG